MKPTWIALAGVLLGMVFVPPQGRTQAARATLPPNFLRLELGVGLLYPTAMAFAGDEILVTQKGGAIRVVKANGKLRKKNFHTLHVSTEHERGLGGIAVDPKYAKNGFIYVYYTTAPGAKKYSGVPQNRLSRLKRVKGKVKEHFLLDHIPANQKIHNGGDVHFGFDGKLYVTVGDSNCCFPDPQELDSLRGKILRLNKDGTIPTDNPFYNTPGARQEIYAFGFRQPWRMTMRAANQTYLVMDVGKNDWEEIDALVPGGNFGWPLFEGPCPATQLQCDPTTVDYGTTIKPIHWYHHNTGTETGTVITGVAFAENSNYPAPYANALFYSDGESGWIHGLTLDTANRVLGKFEFDAGLGYPLSVTNGPDGNIYAVGIGAGRIYKYVYVE